MTFGFTRHFWRDIIARMPSTESASNANTASASPYTSHIDQQLLHIITTNSAPSQNKILICQR